MTKEESNEAMVGVSCQIGPKSHGFPVRNDQSQREDFGDPMGF